jgi:hypothetical protein
MHTTGKWQQISFEKSHILKANASRARRSGSRFDSPLTPGGPETKDFLTPTGHDNDADIFGTHGRGSTNRRNLDVSGLFPPDDLGSDLADSPDASPIRKPFLAANHPTNEIEALRQRLAHAQRQINTLKGSLNHEKHLRKTKRNRRRIMSTRTRPSLRPSELRSDRRHHSRWVLVEVAAGAVVDEEASALSKGSVWQPIVPHPSSTMTSRLWTTPPPPVPAIPIHFNRPDDEDEVSQFFGTSHELEPEDEQEDRQERISRSPSPSPMDSAQSSH